MFLMSLNGFHAFPDKEAAYRWWPFVMMPVISAALAGIGMLIR